MGPNPFFHLRAPRLGVLPGEDDELVNEGLYGKALCVHLGEQLAAQGWTVGPPVAEDWGWWLDVGEGRRGRLGVCIHGRRLGDDTPELDLCVTVAPDPGARRRRSKRHEEVVQQVARLDADLRALFASDAEIDVLGVTDEFPF